MISANIYKVRERIRQACARASRDPSEITLVAVTKGRSCDEISAAVDAGVSDIGENRVQEAAEKFRHLALPRSYGRQADGRQADGRQADGRQADERRPVTTHMIGHLQSNKAKDSVRMFDLIQSVDSPRLAAEIDRRAREIGKTQDILLEIKTSPEATKYGIAPDEAAAVFNETSRFANIRVRGFMTIAPVVDDPEKTRPYFRSLRALRDAINSSTRMPANQIAVLSMGMTDDFEVAIEEGSTMVRLGRALFVKKNSA